MKQCVSSLQSCAAASPPPAPAGVGVPHLHHLLQLCNVLSSSCNLPSHPHLRQVIRRAITPRKQQFRKGQVFGGVLLSWGWRVRLSMKLRRSDSLMRYPRLPMWKAGKSPSSTHLRTVLSLTRNCCATSWTVCILSSIGFLLHFWTYSNIDSQIPSI